MEKYIKPHIEIIEIVAEGVLLSSIDPSALRSYEYDSEAEQL